LFLEAKRAVIALITNSVHQCQQVGSENYYCKNGRGVVELLTTFRANFFGDRKEGKFILTETRSERRMRGAMRYCSSRSQTTTRRSSPRHSARSPHHITHTRNETTAEVKIDNLLAKLNDDVLLEILSFCNRAWFVLDGNDK